MDFGKGIRMTRVYRGVSQKDLAAQTHLDTSYISLIESGSRTPSTTVLRALADALDVPLYLLILLSSEKVDLRGISPEHAGLIGAQLLDLLSDSRREKGHGHGAKEPS